MPEGNESGWSAVFRDLVQDFVLLRDVFGYAIPGATFLLIVSLKHPDWMLGWLDHYKPPHWVTAVTFLLASYVLGNVFAAVYYLPTDCWRLWEGQSKAKFGYTQVDSETLYSRHVVRDIFVELDRRRTTALLRAGLAISCTFAVVFLCVPAAGDRCRLALGLVPLWIGGIWAVHVEGGNHAGPKPTLAAFWLGGIWAVRVKGENDAEAERHHLGALLVILVSLAIPLGIARYLGPGIGAWVWLYVAGAVLWAGDVMIWPMLEFVRRESLEAAREAGEQRDRG